MPHQLQIRSVAKGFPGVRALDDVSFDVAGGTVHALLGENGAGKSTLLNVLAGAQRPDSGQLIIDGEPHAFGSTAEAIRAGVSVIYQELQLVPELSVAENLYLGHLPQRGGWVRRGLLMRQAHALLEWLGEPIDPRVKVWALPIAQRQMVEIAKALSRDARVIAFDEPTSSLSGREVERLFTVIRRLRDDGRVVLYVSHRMEEIYRLCDAATVLRDGRHIVTHASLSGIAPDALVRAMVGRSIQDVYHYQARPHGGPALDVSELRGPGVNGPISFSVASGEILGIFGLVGAGRSELLRLIYGAERRASGSIVIHSRPAAIRSPRDAIRQGLVLCPEDRKKDGIIPQRSVQENVNLSGRRHFSRLGFWIDGRRERDNAVRFIERLGIRTPSPAQLIMNLSGGNQQKAILARWLAEELKVVLLDEPTRGIDVGAKGEIYSIIDDLARRGIGVVVVSSELQEVLGICDRVLVMQQGQIVAELPRERATPEQMLSLALPASSAFVDVGAGAR